MGRHATDRWDWTILAECPNNGQHVPGKTDPDDAEHLTFEGSAANSVYRAREATAFEGMACPICEADLDVLIEEEPAEVIE